MPLWDWELLKCFSPVVLLGNGFLCDLRAIPLIINLQGIWCPYYPVCGRVFLNFSGDFAPRYKSASCHENMRKSPFPLDSITDSMDMNLGNLWEIVRDRKAWHAAVHGVTKSRTQLSDFTTTSFFFGCSWLASKGGLRVSTSLRGVEWIKTELWSSPPPKTIIAIVLKKVFLVCLNLSSAVFYLILSIYWSTLPSTFPVLTLISSQYFTLSTVTSCLLCMTVEN